MRRITIHHLNFFFSFRSILPAFTSLTNAPNVHFIYDTLSERRAELEKLLDSVKSEIEEFESENQEKEGELEQA